ncbi:MAG: hypothetical protein HN952_03145 [Candidatus Cloacimonetes bacterium]|nr:hypothetical protein [Candidatus Cloacimonadota bacterium]MBT6993932.1 hypothetical protein [Candidatus Cloacimonadota bacterium]
MKIRLMLMILLTVSSLFAQLDEREILFKRATRYRTQQQYEKAAETFSEILKIYPADEEVIEQFTMLLIQTKQTKRAEKLLTTHKKSISKVSYTNLQINIMLSKGQIKKAKNIAFEYLNGNIRINDYQKLFSTFEFFKESGIAVQIIDKVRIIANDHFLFAREKARIQKSLNNLELAIIEYLKVAENKWQYANFALSRLRSILLENVDLIEVVEEYSRQTDNQKIHEIYAQCLGDLGFYEKAILEYNNLPIADLKRFAARQYSIENLVYAKKAYTQYIEKIGDQVEIANAKIIIAKIEMRQNNFIVAKRILTEIENNATIKNKKFRYKTRANSKCRELLAEIEQITGGAKYIQYLQDAKNFSFNDNDKKKLDLKIVYHQLLNENYEQATYQLASVLDGESENSEIYKASIYNSYLMAVFQNNPDADSLLTEFILNSANDERTNDLLYLSTFLENFQDEENRQIFLKAYRKKLLFQDEEALDILQQLYENLKNEELLILAGDWAFESKDYELAKKMFDAEFLDVVLQNYAKLKLAEFDKNICKIFLEKNQDSVFLPNFRKLLEEK